MSFPASKTTRKKVKKARRSTIVAQRPQLTSLVDIMTVLIVFLLKSFSAEGQIITPSKGLTVPMSTAKKQAELAFRISVSQKDLLVEGQRLLDVEQMMSNEEIVIPELATLLSERRTTTEYIAKNSTTVSFKGDVIIEADKKVPFRVLQRIMYTCGQEGFSNFALLVTTPE